MSEARIVRVRNVNEALRKLVETDIDNDLEWRTVSPRGMETREFRGTYITEYLRPTERVLFSPERDANPFFHFFEALWILGGRRDVEFLAQFNGKIRDYSDNGMDFHAAYGWRLRRHFRHDQLLGVIDMLRADPLTRRAVMSIWDTNFDLGTESKDIPCNDMVFFKLRDGVLDMTVANRSNDAIWGAYGANAVQFSFIHEFVAGALGVQVGVYRQCSDSFHVYTDNEAWKRVRAAGTVRCEYENFDDVRPYPIFTGLAGHREWLGDLSHLFNVMDGVVDMAIHSRFFSEVALPMWRAWRVYKDAEGRPDKTARIRAAQSELFHNCKATDWQKACIEWLHRRGGRIA
jgi:hypothetical protein